MSNNLEKKSPILDNIKYLDDLRNISESDLDDLASEIRQEIINSVSVTGGHLGANLGVVELTIALHYIFNTPNDKLLWDVSHQTYPHKILTGRRNKMLTIRQEGGLSGFAKRSESKHDPFGAGHASTSISAALGMATARDLNDDNYEIISVIGDGAMSAGMAYEAMNNAGSQKKRMIVVLNDNDMSINHPVGAMSAYFSRLISGKMYLKIRDRAKQIAKLFPQRLEETAMRAEEFARGMAAGGTLFEELGFYYVGPIDGHKFEHLLPVLRNLKNSKQGPILLHVVTKKGKGYGPAEKAEDKFHGVGRFNVITGKQVKPENAKPSYSNIFGENLTELANRDKKLLAITAAMPDGTGLGNFSKKHPKQFYDVGIAEQHAVTFAAGLACEDYKPFVAIYSTFLQRAYDQIVHDVAIQKLPVRFAIDRAGLVGNDGATHAGSFDIGYLASIPNMVVMAASSSMELTRMIKTSYLYEDGPISFRYPRGEGSDTIIPNIMSALPIQIGKSKIIKEGKHIAFLNLGTRLKHLILAHEKLAAIGINSTIIDARFAKPLDESLILDITNNHDALITIEEGAVGGFASQINQLLSDNLLLGSSIKIKNLLLPDIFIDHANMEKMYKLAKLDASSIYEAAKQLLNIGHNQNTDEKNQITTQII